MSEKPHRPSSSASSKPGAKPAAGKETASGQDSELQSSNAPQKKPDPTQQKKNPPGSYLLYLSGLPVDAKYQEVVSLVQSFGKVTNVLIIRNEEGDEDQGSRNTVKPLFACRKSRMLKHWLSASLSPYGTPHLCLRPEWRGGAYFDTCHYKGRSDRCSQDTCSPQRGQLDRQRPSAHNCMSNMSLALYGMAAFPLCRGASGVRP
ncbi:uncharacterized protein LOC135506589 [Oncorhynchus masou masou]|uniref:uncharacterized protein LOC135506589 n=1 Tax=Oncorhynchus masou masou TaxID=90313 RepID=UPI0031833782